MQGGKPEHTSSSAELTTEGQGPRLKCRTATLLAEAPGTWAPVWPGFDTEAFETWTRSPMKKDFIQHFWAANEIGRDWENDPRHHPGRGSRSRGSESSWLTLHPTSCYGASRGRGWGCARHTENS